MNCPKCSGDLETVSYKEIEFERCDLCQGLWFDLLEKEDLLKIEGSESIDIGDDQVGKQYQDIRSIDCPKCHQRMVPMIDKDQFHIKYESCQSCYGTFFDAGEFTDLKERTILDSFAKMISALRTHL